MHDFEELKQELITKLNNSTGNVTNFLETNKSVYVIETDMQTNKEIFINPAVEILGTQKLVEFDVYQNKKDSISYLEEEEKLSELSTLIKKLDNATSNDNNIFKTGEKIKYFYIKCDGIIFIYRYTAKAYLKPKAYLKVWDSKELELVTEEENRIALDKQIPDMIFDTDANRAFLFNVTQSEYIIELDVVITKTMKGFNDIQTGNKIFSANSFCEFEKHIEKMSKTTGRKFVKMIENETYQKFVINRDKAESIKEMYELDIDFNDDNEIDFNENTNVEHILHLLSDDCVQSYLDSEHMVRE